MRYITGDKLKGDIYTYRRLKGKRFTQKNYYKSEDITDRADDFLKKYAEGSLGVRDQDKKIMALYIDTFAKVDREELLNKLQKDSVFNVRQYIKDSKRTYWQRIFNINPDKPKQISARGLLKRIRQYKAINKELANGWFHKEKSYETQSHLESEALHYASDFMADKVVVTRKDAPVLNEYFNTFNSRDVHTDITSALEKLKQMPAEAFAQKAPSRWQTLWATATDKWNALKTKAKTQYAGVAVMNRKYLAKAAAVSAFFAIVGAATLKSDSLAKEQKIDDTELKAKTPKAPVVSDQKTKTDAFKTAELTAEQKIWQNFYGTKNELRALDMNIDLNKLYTQIKAQQEAGIFQMPENISIERFAYTHLIYQAYGFQSPLDQAINGTQKITAAQQKEMLQAIQTAGENGVGVQILAAQAAHKRGVELNHHSAYNNAPASMKAKYADAVKQVKDYKQRAM